MEGAAQRATREMQLMRAGAWLTAALGRVKKMPDLEKFVGAPRDKRDEVRRWVEAWDKIAPHMAGNRKA